MASTTFFRAINPSLVASRFSSHFISHNFVKSALTSHSLFAQTRKYADSKLVTVKVPHLADSITEGTFKTWQKEIGEFVELDEEIGSIETDKVDIPINSPTSGIMKEHCIQNDENVVVGQNMCVIDPEAVAPTTGSVSTPIASTPTPSETTSSISTPAPISTPVPTPAPASTPTPAPASIPTPVPTKAPTSTKTEKPQSPPSSTLKPADATPKSTASFSRTEHKVSMTRMRARIAERLKQSQNTAAALTQFNEIDMTNLMELRSKFKGAILEKHGIKLGFMSTFVAACSKALSEIPAANARVEDNTIIYNDYVDMSVAVATPNGLVTPVVRNAESLNLVQIETEIAKLGAKARANKLAMEDLTGGTFTLSNGGVFGSMMGTPIINMPQSAIFGMHGIQKRAMVINDKIEIRPMMYIALTYDHRIIDGREATQFLLKVKSIVEDPSRLLFDL
ncbi:hypothetical protein BB561_003186 [Smittium simulii]|uniref:dihydrolipoyllysine-residue succinyltransferase n=1 Tax=Smittium simulii TaxID=133385 RepID=A0A2T9YMN0_9FUNG|nr:hypothetical protein BB561_003186 [Smittium simulii]